MNYYIILVLYSKQVVLHLLTVQRSPLVLMDSVVYNAVFTRTYNIWPVFKIPPKCLFDFLQAAGTAEVHAHALVIGCQVNSFFIIEHLRRPFAIRWLIFIFEL